MNNEPIENPRVYPQTRETLESGMRLRDYFAAQAMQGLVSRDLKRCETNNPSLKWADVASEPHACRVAKLSYEIANAMLEARMK